MNLRLVDGIGIFWLMTTARAAVVGVAASRALGEGTNALMEARAIVKMIIRMKAMQTPWSATVEGDHFAPKNHPRRARTCGLGVGWVPPLPTAGRNDTRPCLGYKYCPN